MEYVLAFLILAGFGVYMAVKHLPKLMKSKGSKIDKEDIAFRDQMIELTTDFNRTVNTNINILEEKAKELKKLIDLADKKAGQANSLMASLEVASLKIEKRTPSRPQDIVKQVKLLASPDNKYKKIDELIADGLPLEDIARQMGTSRQEVQLIMELKKRREQMIH